MIFAPVSASSPEPADRGASYEINRDGLSILLVEQMAR
jgi:hypothetical protein